MAHRVAWEMANGGPIPDGMVVCHRCDNPPCVNPAHLFVGTRLDNVRDMVMKGRGRYPGHPGERNGGAKLTEQSVSAIRERISRGDTQKEIAVTFGIDPSVVSRIKSGKAWVQLSA